MDVPNAGHVRWREQLAELLATLQHWPWLDTLRTLRQRFGEDRLGLTAGSLTFTTTIALVPLLTVALAVFAAFPIFSTFQLALQKYFLEALVPEGIARQVIATLTEFASKAQTIGAVGLALLFVAALMLMLTIDRTLNGIWRVRKSRPLAQRVLVYWAAATLGPLLLGGSLSMTSYAISASRGLVGGLPGSVELLLAWVEFALLALGMAGLYHYVPNTAVRWRHALSGGLFVAVGIEIAKSGLAWYLGRVPTFSAVYGAFATVPIFLVWIYLVWVVVLLGAVIAAYAPSLQMRIVRRPVRPGHRFQLALTLLRELDRSRRAGRHGASAAELSQLLRADPLQVEPILDLLVEFDWVGRLDEPDSPRHVLLCDAETTPARPLLARLLLDDTAESHAFWQRAQFDALRVRDLL